MYETVCTYTYTHTHIHILTHVYIYSHTYIYVYSNEYSTHARTYTMNSIVGCMDNDLSIIYNLPDESPTNKSCSQSLFIMPFREQKWQPIVSKVLENWGCRVSRNQPLCQN